MDWFYESGGAPRGPVSTEELAELLRSGRVAPSSRVWRHGLADWVAAESLEEFRNAQVLEAVPVTAATAPTAIPQLPGPENVLALVLLGVVTLGIYPLVRFYRVARAYTVLGREKTEDFVPLFTAYVVCAGLAAVLMVIGVGVLFWIAAIVLGALVLNRVLVARQALLARSGRPARVTEPGTHMVLWIIGQLTALVGIGVVIVIVQTALFFADHNALYAGLTAPGASAPPAPASTGTDANGCIACGAPLAEPRHFCSNCGARVAVRAEG